MESFIFSLDQIDRSLFLLINQSLSHELLDPVMVFASDLLKLKVFQFGILPLSLAFWYFKKRNSIFKVLLALVLCIGLTDLFCYRVLKPFFERPRPNLVPEIAAVLRTPGQGHGFGFPSNHAANSFAMATVLSTFYPPYRVAYYSYAGLVSYSRSYVGVHYPGDILFGAFVGSLIAFLFRIFVFSRLKFFSILIAKKKK